MSPALLCDQCLKPLDEDGRCSKHAFAEALDPTDPQDAAFIATRRELMGKRRRPLAWMAFGLVTWLLIFAMVAPGTPAPSWNTQLAIPVLISLQWTTTVWVLVMGVSAVLLKAARTLEALARSRGPGELEPLEAVTAAPQLAIATAEPATAPEPDDARRQKGARQRAKVPQKH